MTFFLNSTSNLSSNGWKLPAEGVNESCMSAGRGRRLAARGAGRGGPDGALPPWSCGAASLGATRRAPCPGPGGSGWEVHSAPPPGHTDEQAKGRGAPAEPWLITQ